MEIRNIIEILILFQLVIVSWMCINNAKKYLELLEIIEKVDKKHIANGNLIIELIWMRKRKLYL